MAAGNEVKNKKLTPEPTKKIVAPGFKRWSELPFVSRAKKCETELVKRIGDEFKGAKQHEVYREEHDEHEDLRLLNRQQRDDFTIHPDTRQPLNGVFRCGDSE